MRSTRLTKEWIISVISKLAVTRSFFFVILTGTCYSKTLVQSGCRALLTIVNSVEDPNLLDQDTVSKLRNLVIFYVDKGDGTHPAKLPLLGIEKWLKQLEK